MKVSARPRLYGILAEFDTPTAVVAAASKSHAAGYRSMDAFSPFPIEELSHAMHVKPTILPFLVLLGGLFGAISGYGLQWWASEYYYPLIVGGRPLNAWPMFIPVTFEMTILCFVDGGTRHVGSQRPADAASSTF